MLSFKLRNYSDLERSITTLLTDLNKTPVSASLAPYIDGTPAVEINAENVLQRQRQDKAAALPNAKEFQKAGVDLSLNIPNCPVSGPQLNAIGETVANYAHHHRHYASRYISYSQRGNKWVVNATGNKALADATTTLTGAEEKTYQLTVQLFEHVAKHSPDLVPILFPEGKHSGQLQTEWLVNNIRMYRKK